MKRIRNKNDGPLVFAIFMFLIIITFSKKCNPLEILPYIGIDSQINRIRFKEGYGNNLLHKNYPQGNLYAALKFNDCVGVEAGFELTETLSRETRIYAGELAIGTPINTVVAPVDFKSKINIKGPHIDLVGFYSFGENIPIQLLGSIGVSFFKGTAERRTLQFGNPPQKSMTNRTLSSHKSALRIMGGLKYNHSCNIGFRTTVSFIKTGNMIIYSNDGLSPKFPISIKLRDSFIYSIGIFYEF
jgi:opacity protein-like surface antigen